MFLKNKKTIYLLITNYFIRFYFILFYFFNIHSIFLLFFYNNNSMSTQLIQHYKNFQEIYSELFKQHTNDLENTMIEAFRSKCMVSRRENVTRNRSRSASPMRIKKRDRSRSRN